MIVALSDLPQDIELKSGQTYRVEVKGQTMELRELPPGATNVEAPMLDAWVEFPMPDPQFRAAVKS